MTYTPLRQMREASGYPAKAANAAKIETETLRSTFATFATFADPAAQNTNIDPALAGDLEERAAIIAEGARVPPEWAEGFATLEAKPAPAGVDQAAWLAVLNAAGRFLDQWGGKAAALGWTAGELFGLDPAAPLNRRDHRGAAFFLANADVVAITAEAITLKIGGSLQTIRRRDGFTVPAWEMPL